MTPVNRRDALKMMAAAPLLGVLEWTPDEVKRSAMQIDALRTQYQPQFFNDHEWRTVHVLVDLIIPADEHSGSATDAQVPEFMDFMLNEGSRGRQNTMREGLAWLDAESRARFDADFLSATDAQRRAILDDISWPDRAPESVREGVGFFNSFRDMTAAGFFSSRIGYDDLQYMGNAYVPEWTGCPEPALRKLGVSYDLMETRR
ncbi:MAG: gluconate 2-dehydrogenase subunit 3 family protein [Gemmatimonadota bacterium]